MRNKFILFAAIAAICPNPAGAQEKSGTYSLEGSSVNGSRVPLQLNQAARTVTIMDTLAIKALPAKTINDLLKYAIGVDVRQRGGEGIQTDIGIRGGTFDQIAILLNGVNVSDPQTGHFALDLPVAMNEIERIEIMEGPAGRIYGTSSLAGAINIVTRTAAEPSADFHIEGGSYGYFGGGMRANKAIGGFNSQISASCSRADGYERNAAGSLNSDYKTSKAFYQGAYSGKNAEIRWQAGLSGKGFGANTFYSAKYDNQYEKTFKTYAAIQAETKGPIHFKPVAYWNHSNDKFELFRGSESIAPYNYHRSDVYGLNVYAYFETVLGKTGFGAEMRNESIASTALGDTLDKPIRIKGTGRTYSRGLDRTSISYFLEHDIALSRWTFSGGLAAIGNTGSGMNFGIYPGMDASCRLLDNWKAYASYNTSLRMPTFTELYYSIGGHKADKYLKPEKMKAFEAGLKYLHPGLRIQAGCYFHHGTDIIDWVKDSSSGDDSPWTSVNHTEINTMGEEFSTTAEIPLLTGKNCFIGNVSIGCSHMDQDKRLGKTEQSKYSMEYLRNKIVAKIEMHLSRRLDLNVAYRWQERAGNYEVFDNGSDSGSIKPYKPFSIVDAKISWSASGYDIFLYINNLLNYTYCDYGNIPQPGIWIKAGISYSMDL